MGNKKVARSIASISLSLILVALLALVSNSTIITAMTTTDLTTQVNETFINITISENIGLKANVGTSTHLPVKQSNSLIILNSSDTSSIEQVRNYVMSMGGKIRHVYPHILIGYVPEKISQNMIGQKNIVNIYHTAVNSSKLEKYGKTAVYAADAWNKNFMGLGPSKKRSKPDPGPIMDDALIPPDYKEAKGSMVVHHSPPSDTETSLFMIRDISVAIIFLESNSSIDAETENWTSTEESDVINEIQAGLDWWINKEQDADITFTYGHTSYDVPTSYEPITRPHTDQNLWITEAMSYLGYTSGGYMSRVRTYDDDIRDSDGTDWGFTIFVVDSSNDADDKFSDNYFAYAYLAGPLTVMTYGNDGYGIDDMDTVIAHETGHIFQACDEYTTSGCTCTETCGYLNIQNQNCDDNCSSDVACIMRGDIPPYTNHNVCTYTKYQLGWRDTDSDNILDAIDSNYNPDDDTDSDGIVDYWDDCPTVAGPPENDGCPSEYSQNLTISNIGDADLNVTSITDNRAWITSISPTSFTVSPSSSKKVTVTVDPDGYSPGIYSGTINISSNDPDENPKTVTVIMNISKYGDGDSCSSDSDCVSNNCVTAINEGSKYCAASGKECSRSGYDPGYDTGDEYGAYICKGDDLGGQECNSGNACHEYGSKYCDGVNDWVTDNGGNSQGQDANCNVCVVCSSGTGDAPSCSSNIADHNQDTTGSNQCTATCKECDGAGNCANQADDDDYFSHCGLVECDGDAGTPYYYGWDSLTCYYRQDEADSACDGSSACKTASDYCPSNLQNGSSGVSCDCDAAEIGCSGTTIGSCDNNLCDSPPNVTLVSPKDNNISITGNLLFNCSATDDIDLDNITLYHNISGAWQANETKTLTGTSDYETFTINNILIGSYKWNCLAHDNSSQLDWGNNNFTITIKEIGEKIYTFRNSSGSNVAYFDDLGNLVLKGNCTSGGACSAPTGSTNFRNSTGGTVAYIDNNGNLCIETGDCSGNSPSCNPSNRAFTFRDSSGTNAAYIDLTNGDLCLTGGLEEYGNP